MLVFLRNLILVLLVTGLAAGCDKTRPSSTTGDATRDSSQLAPQGPLHTTDTRDVQGLARLLRHPLPQRPLISAHRGGATGSYPENAIETCAHTLSIAPALLELDVQQTADGQLVLLHDDKLERRTTGTGKVSTSTLAQLQKLQLKDKQGRATPYRIPTLDEALQWARGKAIITLDIKQGLPPETILAAIRKHKAQHYVVVITYNYTQAAAYHKLDPDIWVTTTVGSMKAWEALQRFAVDKRRMLAWLGVRAAPTELLQTLHQAGIACMQGTIGDIDRNARQRGAQVYQDLVQRGVDIIATDEVQAVAAAFQ